MQRNMPHVAWRRDMIGECDSRVIARARMIRCQPSYTCTATMHATCYTLHATRCMLRASLNDVSCFRTSFDFAIYSRGSLAVDPLMRFQLMYLHGWLRGVQLGAARIFQLWSTECRSIPCVVARSVVSRACGLPQVVNH